MQRPGGEAYFTSLHRGFAEKLVQKSATVAVQFSAPRNVSGNTGFFQIDLNKFTIAQEAVHAGDVFGCLACGRGLSGLLL